MPKNSRLLIFFYFLINTISNFSSNAEPITETKQIFNPIYGNNGVVATQEELASKIGADILAKGGNAVDAAVAVGYALAVTLPKAGNLGGGGFMLIWLNKEKKSIVINYREQAPKAATKDMFLAEDGTVIPEKSLTSSAAVGVPGTVYGLNLALSEYGTLSLVEVMKPAIALAKNGILVTQALTRSLEQSSELLLQDPTCQKVFYKNGEALQPGSILVQNDLAKTLEKISQKGTAEFYTGSTAIQIANYMKQNGGLITLEDLKDYRAEKLKPIEGTYRGHKILSVPPPSSGGLTLIETLNILENFDLKSIPFPSAAYIHLMTEATNIAYNDRNNKLGDPDFVTNPISDFTSKKIAKDKAKLLNLIKHTNSDIISENHIKNSNSQIENNETTHFSVIDQWGNIVSNTYTLNGWYGSGRIATGTGIFLNNEMDDFSAKPGTPNMFGLVYEGLQNSIAPKKRPLSSMTPAIVFDESNNVVYALGSIGGSKIITQVLQFIVAVFDYNYNIATAMSIPKFHSQLWPDVLYYENGLSDDTLKLLIKQGHHLQKIDPFGSLQVVQKEGDTFYGASDPRSEGDGAVGVIK